MANPFGLEPGSTPPAGMATYHLVLHSVPKPHPGFKTYMGSWRPDHGLVQVSASSDQFTGDPSAASARKLYDQVKRQLTQRYGEPQSNEAVTDEIWADEREFCSSLGNGERDHACVWTKDDHQLDDNLNQIFLMVNSEDSYETSSVSIMYEFPGYDEVTSGDEYGLDSL